MAQDKRNCALTAAFCLFLGVAIAEDMMLSVNVKKPVAVVSDRFLSVTLDPVVLFNSDLSSDAERATSMAKALSPAYVRIGGPRSNSYVFERNLYPKEAHPDPGYTFSENLWIQVHQWAGKSGLDIIACIAPQQSDSSSNARYSSWDPRNALDLISFSDHMGYNTSWQLGYECQTRCDVSGSDLARDVQRLRGMLDAFPRYAEGSLITGPDVVTYKTRQQQQYLQEYFSVASGSLSAVTWHPDFASVSLESEGVSMHYDNLAMDKDSFYRIAGRYIMKKPLWLAESRPEDCKGQFLGALVWARRLGNSAKLGIQVLMRQPVESNLFRPTPDYWVSMLHKMLVGREVLDTRIAAGNRTHVNFYCQCTRPSSRYEKGSLTVFGINLTPTKVTASLKGLKLKVVHKYILLPGYDAPNRMFAETVLLNNELLSLIDGKEVPDVQPVIASTEKGAKLKLPSGGIGFWVLPGLKIKTCMGHEEDMAEKNMLKKISKRLEDVEIDEGTELEDNNSREAVDLNSTEDRKLSLKQQQLLFQKRQLSRRNTRHRDDERDEQDEKKIRRFDAARHDFDRMDRVVRRRDHHAVSHKSGGYHGFFVNSDEEENNNSEEGIIRKLAIGQKLDSGEVIRTKLEEYKKRLADYENRKKNSELTENLAKEHLKDEQPDSANKGMDTEKVIEALTLITKVESAMKGLEKIDDIEVQPVQATVPTLNANNSNDVTAGLPQTSTNSFNRGDDMLLDEVLNTEKAKRTSIPSRIEDQLKALYRLLSEEKDRREAQSVQRRRRDLDKNIGADPLGLRRGSPFLRKRAKGEDGKDRPIDRKSERRQRLREKLDLRREKDEQRRDSHDSIENNFYGFQYREPLKNFPEGDVYLQTADSSIEEKDPITVYTSDVVENKPKLERSKNSFNLLPTATVQPVQDEHEDLWLEEGESNHMPNEFYENVKPQGFNAKNNLKNYGEVGEAEALPKNGEIEKHVEEPADYVHHDIVTERALTELENRQAKEKAVQQLVNYYASDPNQNRPYAFEQNQQPMYFQQPPVPNFPQVPMVEKNDPYFAEQNRYMNQDRFYVNPNPFIPPGQIPYQRVKRHINDLEDVLRQEMISQDDNNLRDCQCRVIRGDEECKDCIQEESHATAPSSPNSLAGARKSAIYNHSNGIRYRRDIEAVEGTYDPAELSVIETGAPDEVVVPASLEEHIEIENPLNGEVNEEDLIEAKDIEESPPIEMEYQMQLEDAGDEQLPGNRLPRKTNTASKFFRNAKQSVTNSPAKENPRSSRQNINSFANNFSTSSRPYIVSSTEAVKTYPTVIRPVEDAPTQAQSTTSPKATSQIYKEVTEQKQPFRVESTTIINIETNTKSISKKSAGTGSSAEDKGKDGTKNINAEGKSGQGTGDKNTVAPLLTTSAVVKNTTATKSKSQTLKNVKKINTTNAEPKNKTKYNNNSGKMDEIMKTRQARLTTRAEALAALRKENESRRTKKMIEASLKIIDTENAKFTEFQRRRQGQLERLKRKLRAKREKILEQYREELIEAISESSDPKERTLRRRDLLEKYQAADDESRKSDMINDQDKLAYIMRYRPLKFGPEEDDYKPSEDRRYVSAVVDLIRPYQESKRKYVLERNQARINNDYDNDEYETNRDKKLGIHLDRQFISEQLYDTSNEHNYKSTNRKRSPFTLIDKPEPLNEHNLKSPVPLEGDSGEFYSQLHPEYEAELHSTISYEEDIPLHVKYNQPPQDSHQQPLEQLEKQPLALDQENPHDINAPNVPQQEYLNYYDIDQEHIQHPYNEYYNPNQENVQQPPPVMNNFGVPPHGDIVEHLPLAPNYPKSKRSSLKVLEIDPSIFEGYEPEYNMQELFMRPTSRFSSRSYRHYPHGYANRRYRRQALNKAHDDGPLSFSLSLEKSKNKHKKATITAPLAELIRTKRITDGDSINKSKAYVENKSTIKKNIKKVHKTAYDLKYKKLIVKPKYARLLENKSLKPINAVRQEYCEIPEPFDNISTKIKTLDPNNIIKEDENRESLLKRLKRSFNENYNDYEITKANKINRLEDPEINQILKNIVEMEQDEALLHEYDRQNNDIIKNFRESQLYFKDYMESTVSPGEDITKTTTKIFESTTQANIESMLVDAIPKLENVITGGLVKAQNITGSLEDFIENLDDQFSSVTENSRNDTESAASTEENDGRISHNVFQSMVGSVKKFFTLVSDIAKIFYGH